MGLPCLTINTRGGYFRRPRTPAGAPPSLHPVQTSTTMAGKPSTKIVIAIVLVLALAYALLSFLSADDGIPDDADEAGIEEVVPGG